MEQRDMPNMYLHDHKDFPDLLRIIEVETGIKAGLVEKDYWIMHVLHGLKKQGFDFKLKGGTSLSKGYGIIHRFSEDIDIYITPPSELKVNTNPKNTKPNSIQSRKEYYDWLEANIQIDGIIDIKRDHEFDDVPNYRSGGIRLHYQAKMEQEEGTKEGILLEVGFDTVTPDTTLDISSWAYERAAKTSGLSIHDNRAIEISCYYPGYTFVEKLQTIATKFRQEKDGAAPKKNLMRQYYDIYCLLENPDVLKFIGTEEYKQHKNVRFPKVDLETPIAENEAFLLSDPALRQSFKDRYLETKSLYYNGQTDFDEILDRIRQHLSNL